MNLSFNQIDEIKGLDTLINLRYLSLGYNKITEIKGLKNLTNLSTIRLEGNPLVFIEGYRDYAQNYVNFCKKGERQKKYKPNEIGKCEDCNKNFPKSKIKSKICWGCDWDMSVCPDCFGDGTYTCKDCYEKFDAMSK